MMKLSASEKSINKVHATMMKIRDLYRKSPRYIDSEHIQFGEDILLYDATTSYSIYFVATYQGVLIRIYNDLIKEFDFENGVTSFDFVKWSRDFLDAMKLHIEKERI